jgi:hypothetical protein
MPWRQVVVLVILLVVMLVILLVLAMLRVKIVLAIPKIVIARMNTKGILCTATGKSLCGYEVGR